MRPEAEQFLTSAATRKRAHIARHYDTENEGEKALVGVEAARRWRMVPMNLMPVGHRFVERVAAKDAYTSSLFKLCRRYAERYHAESWLILSAKYGLLHPNTKISNYDVTLDDHSPGLAHRRLANQWRRCFAKLQQVKSLAGSKYNVSLVAALPRGVKLETPMAGLDLFGRLAWLKNRLVRKAGFAHLR